MIAVKFSSFRNLSCKIIALCLLCFAFHFSSASTPAQDNGNDKIVAGASYSYQFDGPRFYVPMIEIDLTPNGTGELRFRRGESDEIFKIELKLLSPTIERIRQLYSETDFLRSTEEYQNKKDFSHLGWTTLAAREGERERKARFNYTTNLQIDELSRLFRGIATQEMHLFDLETMEQYQPLDLPRQLEALESSLRLEQIAEPERILKALREISSNDSLPLIARNKASRIVSDIEKRKYKSPIKK